MSSMLQYLPLIIVQQQNADYHSAAEGSGSAFRANCCRASYPDQRPTLMMSQQQGNQYGYQQNTFPPSNRYISAMQLQMIQQGFSAAEGRPTCCPMSTRHSTRRSRATRIGTRSTRLSGKSISNGGDGQKDAGDRLGKAGC